MLTKNILWIYGFESSLKTKLGYVFIIFKTLLQKNIGCFFDKSHTSQNSHHTFRRLFYHLLLVVRFLMAPRKKVSMFSLKKLAFFADLVLYYSTTGLNLTKVFLKYHYYKTLENIFLKVLSIQSKVFIPCFSSFLA